MSDLNERRQDGRFAKGQSGNPDGARTRRRKELINSEDIARVILGVAASRKQITIAGEEQNMSLLEFNVWSLATGKPANRLAAKDMIDLTKDAAYHMDRLAQREEKRERGF